MYWSSYCPKVGGKLILKRDLDKDVTITWQQDSGHKINGPGTCFFGLYKAIAKDRHVSFGTYEAIAKDGSTM